ncbi:MAG: hypothetical protein HOE54_03850 [Gammaproteobacteria bacterium]|jgi:hypothetical protein|nr:hypothetical protein [Gammaproteobacteria bacterium]MBT7370863.1 hypothetical protein [Gammaproteobacteria bacterium]
MSEFWYMALGLGMAFQGILVIWVGRLPRAMRRGTQQTAEKGSTKAFQLFWLDQYSYIGLSLTIFGLAITAWGYFS